MRKQVWRLTPKIAQSEQIESGHSGSLEEALWVLSNVALFFLEFKRLLLLAEG
jgi:hypothetical protein